MFLPLGYTSEAPPDPPMSLLELAAGGRNKVDAAFIEQPFGKEEPDAKENTD